MPTTMKNHVVSLKLAKRLNEANYPQESEFYWYERTNELIWGHSNVGEVDMPAAPLATELLERLPVPEEKLNWKLYKTSENKYWVSFFQGSQVTNNHLCTEVSTSLPDALAEMWLWLKVNNYLTN